MSKPLVIAHFGDVHIAAEKNEVSEFSRYLGKRILGTVNLRLMGRGNMFEDARRRFRTMLSEIKNMSTDFIFSSGDFSAMSYPIEFSITKKIIEEELSPDPKNFAVIPGNHDRYTISESVSHRFNSYFDSWMVSDIELPGKQSPFPFIKIVANRLAFLFVDVVRFHPLSRGKVTQKNLHYCEQYLNSERIRSLQRFMVIHYPPVRADGSSLKFEHRCVGIDTLLKLAVNSGISALFTGHVHENYIVQLPKTYIINAGSATFNKHSTYNVYTFDQKQLLVDRREFSSETNRYRSFDQQTLKL